MAIAAQAAPFQGSWQRVRALLGSLKQRIATARDDARVRADLEYELACLDRMGELDGVLDNLGLSRAAIPMLVRQYPGAMRRYLAMTRRLGIGAQPAPNLRAGIDALFGPRLRCLLCSKTRPCDAWLRSGTGAEYRGFCPNAPVFERMRKAN
jgi:hypothetical protein